MWDLIEEIEDESPKFNPEICDGVPYSQMTSDKVEKYMDLILRGWVSGLPTDYEYINMTRCGPVETLNALSRLPNRAKTLAIEPNDVYLVRVQLKWRGTALKNRYLLFPVIRRGGFITIRNSLFAIIGVLADNFFSVEKDTIHISLTKSKFNVNTVSQLYLEDGVVVTGRCAYSMLYNISENEKIKGKDPRVPLFANYLFIRHGLKESFKYYFDVENIHFGDQDINVENYPRDKWVICSSAGDISPVKKQGKSFIKIAIAKDEYKLTGVKDMIASFFYIMDHCHNLSFMSLKNIYSVEFWKRILIRFIFKNVDKEIDLLKNIESHQKSIDKNIEALVIKRLRSENLPIATMDDLMVYLIKNFGKILTARHQADCSAKNVVTLPYVMYDIVYKLTNIIYALNREEKKHNIGIAKIESILDFGWPTTEILNLGNGHGEVSAVELCNDCFMTKVTTKSISQIKAVNIKKPNVAEEARDFQYKQHPSVINVFTYLAISKSNPFGRGMFNPFMRLDRNGKVLPIPENQELIDNLYELLDLKSTNNNQEDSVDLYDENDYADQDKLEEISKQKIAHKEYLDKLK